MSDTPRTDAAWQAECKTNEEHTIILLDCAAGLERDLCEARIIAQGYHDQERRDRIRVGQSTDARPGLSRLPWEDKT